MYLFLVFFSHILHAHINLCAYYSTRPTLFYTNKHLLTNYSSLSLRYWRATGAWSANVAPLNSPCAAASCEYSSQLLNKVYKKSCLRAVTHRASSIHLIKFTSRVWLTVWLTMEREWEFHNPFVAFAHKETLFKRHHPKLKHTKSLLRSQRPPISESRLPIPGS